MSVTLPPRTSEHGQAEQRCEHTCCALHAPVRPRFFCGQLLTDADMMAFVDWTADKLRLTRYRRGWGIVCGLDVRCDPHPDRKSGVIISPGYALSCCGDDIVVAEDYAYDLARACQPEPDPCDDIRRPRRYEERSTAVDLYVCYRQENAEPQTALAHRVCGEGGACDYSRTWERFGVTWQPVSGDRDPVCAAADRWEDGYDRCLEILTAYNQKFTSGPFEGVRLDAVRKWLRRWVDGHPLHQFCFVRDEIGGLDERKPVTEGDIARLLFLLVQDCRNAYLTCSCHACEDSPGVPLARVWLHTEEQGRRCKVVAIDPYPPYRRPLRTECWPAPLGWVNVGQVIWHRWEGACARLADLGVSVVGVVDFAIPATVAALKAALTCRPFVECGEEVVVQLFEFGGSKRVVGFCGAAYSEGYEAPKVFETPESSQEHSEHEEASEAPEHLESKEDSENAEHPGADDLEQIHGIGRVYARKLRAAGFGTFDDLAQVSWTQLKPLFQPTVTKEQLEGWIRDAAKRAKG